MKHNDVKKKQEKKKKINQLKNKWIDFTPMTGFVMTKTWDLALEITWLASMTAEMNQKKLVFGIFKTWQAKKINK